MPFRTLTEVIRADVTSRMSAYRLLPDQYWWTGRALVRCRKIPLRDRVLSFLCLGTGWQSAHNDRSGKAGESQSLRKGGGSRAP